MVPLSKSGVAQVTGSSNLPLSASHHGDPFERLLIAQARAEGLVIVSRDPRLDPYEVARRW